MGGGWLVYRIYRYSEKTLAYKHVLLKRSFGSTSEKIEKVEREFRGLDSLSRTKRLFTDYAYCNRFSLFFTFTFDGTKHNRYDLQDLKCKVCKFFNNYRYRVDSSFRYMMIPELHKDGAVHFHGLCTVPDGVCSPLYVEKTFTLLGRKFRKLVPNTKKYLRWPAFSDRFGFFSASFIRDYEKTVNYCTSYITKGFQDMRLKNVQLLVKSQGLAKPELVYSAYQTAMFNPEFENEFCAIAWQDELQTLPVYKHWSCTVGEMVRQLTEFDVTEVVGRQLYLEDIG